MKKLTRQMLFMLVSILFSLTLSAQSKKITLEDLFRSGKFYPHRVYGLHPMRNGTQYCVLENDSINVYNYQDGKRATTLLTRSMLVPEGDSVPVRLESFTFSQDESRILIPTETESIYRYSEISFYYVYDLKLRKLIPLSTAGKQRLADFSPDGLQVAFVRDNNLIIARQDDRSELQVTTDGQYNHIINGAGDWVYEEEFIVSKGFHWSPDGKKIAYYRFDESEVKEYDMTEWGELYPEEYRYKYPVAGENNAIVTIWVYNVQTQQKVQIDLGTETDQYIPRIFWAKDPGKLFVFRLNRLQNHLEILLADINTGKTSTVYVEDNPAYIAEGNQDLLRVGEDYYDQFFIVDDNSFLLTSERRGYNHIYQFFTDGRRGIELTKGEYDVTDVYGYDDANKLVYFQAAMSSPMNREICSVDLNGKVKVISEREGTNRPEFSTSFRYYINDFSDANTPPQITINKSNGKEVRSIQDNHKLEGTMKEYGFSPKEFFSFTTSEGISLNGYRILPPDFDPEKKYPVLFDIYGGPGSQTVLNRWDYGLPWHQMLAQHGYIIVSVDNRGTACRGEEFKKVTYLQLGKYETIDQIEAARYLAGLGYVDPARIGMWGWSYGGFMSALCITKGADEFSMAISVAPVTNWRYYDNIYTERFMRTPQENPEGYDGNSPIHFVDELKGSFLVIHGTSDDNVHVQNTMDLVDALVRANKQFDMFLYPNKNHSIYGGNTRYHLYRMLTDYILENL